MAPHSFFILSIYPPTLFSFIMLLLHPAHTVIQDSGQGFSPSHHMAAPDQVAVATAATAAELAMSDAGLTGSMVFAEPNLIDLILCDHRAISALFAHFENAAAHRQEAHAEHLMRMHAAALYREILMHSQAELEAVYPVLEVDALGSTDSAVLATTCRGAHRQVEGELLDMLRAAGCALGGDVVTAGGSAGLSQSDLEDVVQRLQVELCVHILEEERMVLPRLAAAHSAEQLIVLGKNFLAAKLAVKFLPAPGITVAAGNVTGVKGKQAALVRSDTATCEHAMAE